MSPTPPADRLIGRFLRHGTRPFTARDEGRFWTFKAWGEKTQTLGLWQLNTFHAWTVDERLDLRTVKGDDLDAFVWGLEHRAAAEGGPWSASAVQGMVQTLRRFYAWADLDGAVEANPARRLRAGRPVEETGPDVRQVHIAEEEHRAMMAACPLKAKKGPGILAARTAAILAVFWATGVRRVELARLDLDDVDFDTGVVKVRSAKKAPPRLALLDEEALEALDRYLDRRGRDGVQALFVTHRKGTEPRRLGLEAISATVRDAGHRARLGRIVACHEYRRTAATEHFLGGGTVLDAETLFGWKRGSRMPGRYVGKKDQVVAIENLRRRRAEAAERERKRRRGA